MGIDYKRSGVDVEAGDALVDWLQAQKSSSIHQDKIVSGIGGFAALFRAPFHHMKDPCLVACTDGVGTKVKIAVEFERYREVAQDMVAMCVNDMICCGADPLFFLDYYATGKLEQKAAREFLTGVREACAKSQLALIGGETAEMPGVYAGRDFDCAGFSVGVVDRPDALGPEKVRVGDQLVAFASSGFHSNGYSLLRKVFEKDMAQWADALLTPTRLYVELMTALKPMGALHAAAHVTGGGMDNIPRVLPRGMRAELESWVTPPSFREVKKRSAMSWQQMLSTLNCGVGFVAVVAAGRASEVIAKASSTGYAGWELGKVVAGPLAEAEADWTIDWNQFAELQESSP